jgi:hypothetical protein
MKWLLILISLSVSDDYCHGPLPLLKHTDELYDSEEDCRQAFQASRFYKTTDPQEVVGFCLPIKPLMLSPKQLTDKLDRPKCW